MPAERITLTIDGRRVSVRAGTSVAAAVLETHPHGCRRSVSGQMRSPVCGMGVCFECRVTIDGRRHQLGCQTACRAGMEVRTDAP